MAEERKELILLDESEMRTIHGGDAQVGNSPKLPHDAGMLPPRARNTVLSVTPTGVFEVPGDGGGGAAGGL